MFSLIAENKYGQRLNLTNNKAYAISSIDGLGPIDATVNTTRNAGEDGTTFNSAYTNERQIILTLAINNPAEMNRINLYTYFVTKEYVKLYYKNSTYDVWIEGYVSEFDVQYFEMKQIAQITILCPQPYWQNAKSQSQKLDPDVALFEFPFSIDSNGIPFSEAKYNNVTSVFNKGNVETGCIITVNPYGTITGFTVQNENTFETFTVNYTVNAGEKVIINTNVGEKSVTLESETRGNINLIGYIDHASAWFRLRPGINRFTLDADGEGCDMLFTVTDKYQGV